MVLVDVGDDGGHFVKGVRVERLPAHHLGHAQWRVHVEAAEVVVDGQQLWRREEKRRRNSLVIAGKVVDTPF